MILVTGAAGRLGQRVVQRLVDRGDDVVGTDARALDDTPSRFVQTDLCDTARVTDLVAQADAVIHMGALPGPRQSEPYEIYRNNGQSTFNIIIATSERGLRRVVFSSIEKLKRARLLFRIFHIHFPLFTARRRWARHESA